MVTEAVGIINTSDWTKWVAKPHASISAPSSRDPVRPTYSPAKDIHSIKMITNFCAIKSVFQQTLFAEAIVISRYNTATIIANKGSVPILNIGRCTSNLIFWNLIYVCWARHPYQDFVQWCAWTIVYTKRNFISVQHTKENLHEQ